MPSIAQAPPSPILNTRKRRRDLDEYVNGDVDMSVVSLGVQMKLANSPHKTHHQTTNLHDQLISSTERKFKTPRLQYKKPRPDSRCDPAQNILQEMETGSEKRKVEKIDLRPCYICHRKPTELRHLDAYADCESCGRRTCLICIRICEGLGLEDAVMDKRMRSLEHREKVCSRCCVERGEEGEVRCLGCLRGEEGD